MRRILNIFRIYPEERMLAFTSAIIFALLNTLTVVKYYGSFSQLSDSYHRLFVRTFHISGFDPLTYELLSNWDTVYNVYRHPLLAFMLWPLNQMNQGLMILTGTNFATIVTAVFLVLCSVYSCIFLFRILARIIGIGRNDAYMLCAMYYGFAFIMLSTMVPDHFILSMAALLMTLYIAGMKLKRGSALNAWQTTALFVLTAGISLNNGLKVFLAALTTRRMRFFRPGFLVLAVILPSLIIWGFARWEYRTFVWPKEMARHELKMKKSREQTEQIRQEVRDSIGAADSAKVEKMVKEIKQKRAVAKYRADHKKIWNRNTGKPIARGEFMRWTDITTPRWDTAVENLFGEAIVLHSDYLLGDVLRDRPVIVRYRCPMHYVFEALIILLFAAGIWLGRKSLLMWTTMSFFMMDMALHVGLGFGINEIYIMSPHYLFVIPIAMAFVLKSLGGVAAQSRWLRTVRSLIVVTTLWCWANNLYLIISYMI
ncbi:MAG: DUF6080 domain-containing protein [Prevotella sp.]